MGQRIINGKLPHFRPVRKRSNYYRVMLLLSLILTGIWVLLSYERGQIKPAFHPTPTPTRLAESYILEAQAYFAAGRLDDPSNNFVRTPLPPGEVLPSPTPEDPDATPVPPTPIPEVNDALEAYQKALEIEPENAQAWAELARIRAYSSQMLSNDTLRLERLKEALEAATRAVELAPDDSMVHAIRAFVLDWYAFNPLVSPEENELLLGEANNEALRAYQLDPNNALALAYYAEILADQQKWVQAEQYARQAVERDPNSMDTHRVLGYVFETIGAYNSAIEQYRAAAAINPNLTFLYIRIGRNYREGIQNPELALEYFDRAAKINEQLGVQNPVPYIEIARTYTQEGQFFAAAVNAQKALSLDQSTAATYAQLGSIFIRARNYEGAVPLLRCAIIGCTAEENEAALEAVGMNLDGVPVAPLELSNKTVGYYYIDYGNVLAFLSRPNQNYCVEGPDGTPNALEILDRVRQKYSDDSIMMSIIEDSEGICRRLASGGRASGTATPTAEAESSAPDM